MDKTAKEFDCVEMKRRIQEEIYEETQDMNHEQFAEYVRDRIRNSRFAYFLDLPSSSDES
jgi:hypothetical protein